MDQPPPVEDSMATSPSKRRFDALSASVDAVPRSLKRLRTQEPTPAFDFAPSTPFIFAEPIKQTVSMESPGGQPFTVIDTAQARLLSQNEVLRQQTFKKRQDQRETMRSGKGTEPAYKRQFKRYLDFFEKDQAERQREDPEWVLMDPHPITATKVAIFLNYECAREKLTQGGQLLAGTRLSYESLKQCISAIEWHRANACDTDSRYLQDPESQKPLRSDNRIVAFEKSMQATESERMTGSQLVKAQGAPADTYTKEELVKLSVWSMHSSETMLSHMHSRLRDRAMLLLSTATAFRGDNTRQIRLSDLCLRQVPMVELGLDASELALVILSDQGKTNTSGRIDEQGAFRHRIPELCAIGGLGFYLFSQYHVMKEERPNFAPDYTVKNAVGTLGFRDWYRLVLFPGQTRYTEMSYENHRQRWNTMHAKNDIQIRKVTHASRTFGAVNAREHRASVEDTKALGNWSQGGSYAKCYDTTLPTMAMVAAAGCNAQKPETYHIARSVLVPPTALELGIFPWLEEEELAFQKRIEEHGKNAHDYALQQLFKLLRHLRRVILQDAAILSNKYPEFGLWKLFPFNSESFQTFATRSAAIVTASEEEARQQLSLLPATMESSLRGILLSSKMRVETLNAELVEKVQSLEDVIKGHGTTPALSSVHEEALKLLSRSKKAQKLVSRHLPAPPCSSQVQVAASDSDSDSEGVNGATEPVQELTADTIPGALPAAGHLQPSIPYPRSVFSLSADALLQTQQIEEIKKLEVMFTAERLHHHFFEWVSSSSSATPDEWLPVYKLPSDTDLSVQDVWDEWNLGRNGHLSIVQLNTRWGARWRRNVKAEKTLYSRRNKIISLITELAAKPGWNAGIALRFLNARFPVPTRQTPHLKHARAFSEFLSKEQGKNFKDIVSNAVAP